MRANKIPDDHPQWGTFTQMQDDTLVRVHRLVERAAALPFPRRAAASPGKSVSGAQFR